MDPRGSVTDPEQVTRELAEDVAMLAGKQGRPRGDGMIVYRGRQTRRYQYVVDPHTDTIVQIRGESEVREQGRKGNRRRGR